MTALNAASIYLLKDTVKADPAAFKDDPAALRAHAVAAGETVGTLYVQVGDDSPPDWVKALAPVTVPALEDTTHSLGAVLILPAGGRRFAVAFGSGRHLLDPDAYVRDFGLLCALNGVDPEQLRGAEARTFDDYALHTLKQLSRLSDLASLELNTEKELVVALSGRLEDSSLGIKVDGRDAVRLTAEIDLAELHLKCTRLFELSQKTAYKDRFPFRDRIRRVTDRTKIGDLNKQAFSRLGQQKFAEFDLFPPQVVSDEIVIFAAKSKGSTRTKFAEPEPQHLKYAIRGPQPPEAVERLLKGRCLEGLNGSGEVVEEWTFKECLHWEFIAGGVTYVLDAGSWYEIDSGWVADVEAFVGNLVPSGIDWPAAQTEQNEDEYNDDAAAALGHALMDQRFVKLKGQTKVEACDLFAAPARFIHVKKRKGGSGPLSHLFAQALVSAEGFVMVPEFRVLLAELLEESKSGYGQFSPADVDPSKYEVVLALITTPGAKGNVVKKLPFFSKVTLRLAVTRLESMGFKVFVDPIVTQFKTTGPAKKAPKKATPSPSGAKGAAKMPGRAGLPRAR
jgi:uncharacterized protein (TIGR04141 family)